MTATMKKDQCIYKHAGKIRDYNITKKEWVLDGATVMYGSASELRATLEYDFSQEKDFSYKGLSHLFVQTIRTCKKVFTKQQSIWKHFSEICF